MEGEPKEDMVTTEERWNEIERIEKEIESLDDQIDKLEQKRTELQTQRVAIIQVLESDSNNTNSSEK